MKKILITGAAGFIGYSLSKRLAGQNSDITGIDNINDYYDTGLKLARLKNLGIDTENQKNNSALQSSINPNFRFIKMDITDRENILRLFKDEKFDTVINLAAQPGIRYSLENPYSYIDSNIVGFINILEGCRHNETGHLVYASSSSVYGLTKEVPFSVTQRVDYPISLYAATKKSNELMAFTYSHLYDIPVTGLRFFTVYGPWGRPDMAYFKFTRMICEGRPIDIYNDGNMKRDFTYIDDITEGIERAAGSIPQKDPGAGGARYKLYNIGNNKPVGLMDFIGILEKETGRKAEKNFLPMQPGDVPETYADIDSLIKDTGFAPKTGIEEGLKKFVSWFRDYYGYCNE